jgi:hypothetical protein
MEPARGPQISSDKHWSTDELFFFRNGPTQSSLPERPPGGVGAACGSYQPKVKHPDNKNPVEKHQKKGEKKVSTVLSKK